MKKETNQSEYKPDLRRERNQSVYNTISMNTKTYHS